MKKFLPYLLLLLSIHQTCIAQTGEQKGKPITEIFTDFHYNFNDTTRHTGFSLNRAYFGYQFIPGDHFTAKIILNAGSPEDLATGSSPRRYAFFREASLKWENGKLSITAGMTTAMVFSFQQNFFGKRYIAKSFQLLNGYGTDADLGAVAEYKFSEIISCDVTIMNGEGYSNIQIDDHLKTSLGFTIAPQSHLVIRLYGDCIHKDGIWQPLAIGFIGYKNDKITIGGDINYKSNSDLVKGHHIWGISSTGAVSISKKTELFLRYDFSTSVLMSGDLQRWNYLKDYSFGIAGMQVTLSPNVKLAFDYQEVIPESSTQKKSGLLYLNGLFKF